MNRTDRPTSRLACLTLGAVLLAAALPAAAAPAPEAKEGKKGTVVNINAADTAQLALLPRVGPSVAQRIVDYRKKNGPFKAPDDLMLVQGIGEKTYELIKPYVATSGETSLKEKVKSGKSKEGKSAGKAAKEGKKAKEPKAGKEASR
jgi:competence protein ComEA